MEHVFPHLWHTDCMRYTDCSRKIRQLFLTYAFVFDHVCCSSIGAALRMASTFQQSVKLLVACRIIAIDPETSVEEWVAAETVVDALVQKLSILVYISFLVMSSIWVCFTP